jgi:hypothetical protein
VTAPPAALGLDPFYKKYADAHGIPIVSSEKTPDEALLMARDIVQFMLSERPDLRRELMRKKWKVGIMAETEKTYDIPEHRKYRLLPKIDDERLTPQQRENYYKPGGVGTMTGEQYWNMRGRGFGGEPDGENTTSCAEENLLGYPGTRYFGQSLLVHEFSQGGTPLCFARALSPEMFPTDSTLKVAIMCAAMEKVERGEISTTIRASPVRFRPGLWSPARVDGLRIRNRI